MRLKVFFSKLVDLRSGALVSFAGGVFSISIVTVIRLVLGESDANLYIFLAALTALVGALGAVGIPEYGQVLLSGQRIGILTVPIFLILIAVFVVVLVYIPESLTRANQILQVLFMFVMMACVCAMLTASELRFRCRLLATRHVRNYFYQNSIQHLAVISAFVFLTYHPWGPFLSLCVVLGLLTSLWAVISSLPLKVEFTAFRFNKEQGAFYLQRITLVLIDTVLLLNANNSINPSQYFAMGIVNRVMSPIFILLNVFLGMRQAAILTGDLNAQVGLRSLILVSSATGIALAVGNIVGLESNFSACLAILLIRVWVMFLSFEFQRWLPDSPLALVLGSGVVWCFAAWLISAHTASLILIVSVSIWINSAIILTMILFKENNVEKHY